jgi:hypothetical protein
VRIELTVTGGESPAEVRRLYSLLSTEPGLRGTVSLVTPPARRGDMGALGDVISVVLGPGGAGVALAGALSIWARSRTSDVRVIVSRQSPDGTASSVEIEIDRSAQPEAVLATIRELLDEGDGTP